MTTIVWSVLLNNPVSWIQTKLLNAMFFRQPDLRVIIEEALEKQWINKIRSNFNTVLDQTKNPTLHQIDHLIDRAVKTQNDLTTIIKYNWEKKWRLFPLYMDISIIVFALHALRAKRDPKRSCKKDEYDNLYEFSRRIVQTPWGLEWLAEWEHLRLEISKDWAYKNIGTIQEVTRGIDHTPLSITKKTVLNAKHPILNPKGEGSILKENYIDKDKVYKEYLDWLSHHSKVAKIFWKSYNEKIKPMKEARKRGLCKGIKW